jgi:hypothetical protein
LPVRVRGLLSHRRTGFHYRTDQSLQDCGARPVHSGWSFFGRTIARDQPNIMTAIFQLAVKRLRQSCFADTWRPEEFDDHYALRME